ncbi:flavodoxin family protein [Microbacterium sp. NPDC055910]|uniref:flavodoxin family protein n=1 Tax=Microbacterium sp. NPDC055910 TaxID=3345659 RepID=UPI0035D54F7E
MPRLLIVHHSPTARVRAIADAVLAGAQHEDLMSVAVVERPALEATVDDVLAADGYVFGTTANFGYLSGALKHFFDTTYYETREVIASRPFGYWIHGGHDTTGAEQAMRTITTGYGLRLAAAPLVFTGDADTSYLEAAADLGATLAAGLLEA